MEDLSVAAFQMTVEAGKKKQNLAKIKDILHEHHRKDIDLWVFPELFTTGFYYEDFPVLAEELSNSNTISKLLELSIELHTGFAGSLLTKTEKSKHQNIGFIISPDKGLIYHYQKIHLWGTEKNNFEAGKEIPKPVMFMQKAKIGLEICYDLRFPEIARHLTINGAEVLITTAAWPSARTEHFSILSRARAIENTCFHIAVNRAGSEMINGNLVTYSGASCIVDPMGVVLTDAGNKEKIIQSRLEKEKLVKTREYIPVLKDKKV
ncbi:MAG: hypothetical protein FK734_07215 [Asgard group archaeon]|nr:hypothetical protein [Asgard group archaeon]